MTCYVVPAAAFVVHTIMRRKNKEIRNSNDQKALNLLFAGASLFGIVDHAWNKELLAFGPGVWTDLLLGLTITVSIVLVWALARNLNMLPTSKKHKV